MSKLNDATIDSLPLGIIGWNSDFSMQFANAAARNRLSLMKDKRVTYLQDINWLDSSGTCLTMENHPVARCFKSGIKISDRIIGFQFPSDNQIIWLEANCIPEFLEGDPKPVQVIFTFSQKSTSPAVPNRLNSIKETGEEFFNDQTIRDSEILQRIGQSVIVTDISGTIRYVNEAACKNFGYSKEEFLQKNVIETTVPDEKTTVASTIMEKLKNGENWSGEFFLKRKEGTIFPAFVTDSPIFNSNGELTGIIGISSDITERKELETEKQRIHELLVSTHEDLTKSNNQLSAVFNNVKDAIVVQDNNGKIIFTNRRYDEIFLHKIGKVENLSINDYRDDFQLIDQNGEIANSEDWPIARVARGEFIKDARYQVVSKKHSFSWYLEYNGGPVFDPIGKLLFSVLSVSDVTIREESLLQLVENEKRYRSLFETNPLPMWIFDTESLQFLEVNHSAIEHYGYSREEFLNMTIKEIRPVEEIPRMIDYLKESVNPISRSDWWQHKKKNGELIDVEIISYSINYQGRNAKHILANDITEKRKALRALESSEMRFRKLFENMAQGVIYQDENGVILSANTAAQQILGLKFDQLLGRTSFNPNWVIIREDGSAMSRDEDPSSLALKSGKEIKNVAIGVKGPEMDEFVWLLVNAVPEFKEGDNKAYRVFTTFNDITWRKKYEDKITESERKFRTLFDTIPNGYYRSTPEGYIVEANPAFIKMVGYGSLEEIKALFIPNELYCCAGEREEIRTENTDFIDQIETYRLKKKNGDIIWIEDNGRCIRNENDEIIYYEGICRDVTDRKLAEDRLRERDEKYRTLFSSMDQGFCIIEKIGPSGNLPMDFRYIEANPAFEEHTGLHDVVGKTIREVVSDPEQEVFEIYNDVILTGKHFQFESYIGSLDIWMEAEVFPTNRANQIAVFFTNITKRKKAEEILSRREMLLNEMGRIANIGGWELDNMTMQQIWTDETYVIHDREKESYSPNSSEELSRFEPGSKEIIEKAFEEAITKGNPYDLELEMTTIKGNKKWVRAVCLPLISGDKVSKLTGTVQDITARRQAEKEIVETRTFFQLLFNFSPVAYSLAKFDDRKIVDVNAAWEELFGYTKGEVIGRLATDFNFWYNPKERDAAYQQLKKGGKLMNYESTIQTKSGLIRSTSMFTDLLELDGTKYIFSVFVDITEQRQNEENLAKLAERLNLATQSAGIGIYDWDISKNILVWDNKMIQLYGLRPDQFNGASESWIQGIHPADREETSAATDRAVRGEEKYNKEFRVVWPDGSIHWLKADGEVFRDESGSPVRMVGVNYDITERKIAEANLKRWADTFENVAFGFVIGEPGIKTLGLMNPAFARMHGYTVEELADFPILDLIVPEARNELAEKTALIYQKGHHSWESRHIRKDGSTFPVHVDAVVVKDKCGTNLYRIISIQDITLRKQAELKLLESEQKLKLFVEFAPAAIAMFDTNMNYIAASKRFSLDYGIKDSTIIGRSHYEIFPEIGEEWKAVHRRCLSGATEINLEDRFERADGSIDWVHWEIHPWYQTNDTIGGIILFSELITERKKAKLNLESSESKFRSIAENLTDVIAITDKAGRITYISPASLRVFGYSSEEMTGRLFNEFLAPEEGERVIQRYKENLALNVTSQNLLIKAQRKNGEMFYAEISSSMITEDKNINGRLALIRDVTELLSSEIRERNRSRIMQMLTEEFNLEEILHEIQQSIEEESPESICTILLIDKSGNHLLSSVPNQLPDFYNQAINGLEIVMGNGSCGTAAFTLETVFVEDVLTHPYWVPFKALALKAGIKSCWSKPVIAFNGQLLGTFAIYHRVSRIPNEVETARIEHAANLTRLAIEKKTSEKRLRESEAKFKAVFENAPVGISLLDNQRNLLESNNMLAHMVRMDEASLATGGYRARKYIREDGSELTVGELASSRAIAEQRPIRNLVNGIVLESGEIIWTQISAAPLGPNDPRYVVITQDISERKKALDALSESESRLRKTIESTADGFWIVDPGRRFIEVNEAYCKMSGYSRQELMTMSISDIEASETIQETDTHIQKIIRQGGDRFETVHRRKDGSLFNAEVGVNVLDEEQGLMICFCRDITERKQAEAQLRESEKRFTTIFEDSPVAIAISRMSDGKIIHVNKSAIDLFGFSREEMIGNTTTNLGVWAIPEDRQHFFDLIVHEKMVEKMDSTVKQKTGQLRQVLVWGESIELAGEPCIMVEIIDNHEKKKQEEEIILQNKKLNAILNALPDKLFVHDLSGNFLEAYTTDPSGFIVPIEQFIGRNLSDIFSREVAELNLKYLHQCHNENKIVSHEFSLERESFTSHFEVRVVPFMEDKVIRFVRDITEKKKNEQEILDLNVNLERKVEERTNQLTRTNEELIKTKEAAEEANKAKSIFLANMSHEIRTPLNSIIGFSELLYNSSTDHKKRSQIESIRNSGKNLLNIINDILDLSKVEAGKIIIEPEPLNVLKMVREVVSMFEQKAAEKKLEMVISMESELTEPLLLDETRLRQILFNLIGNAIKFTPLGGVSVFIHHEDKSNGLVDLQIKIVDTGIGIQEDQFKAIFEPFVQQQGQIQKNFGGTGLGLAISSKMAKAMGGEIQVFSKVNEGSSFTIYLKNVSKADTHPELESNERAVSPRLRLDKKSILIVDDVADNRELLWDFLEPTGAHLLEAENGVQAIQIASNEKPDIVLMDIRMPVMDGMEACKILKQTPITANIPCIAVTASIKLGRSGKEIPEYFDESLMKPIDFQQLTDILIRFLVPTPGNDKYPPNGTDFQGETEKEWSDELILFVKEELAPLYFHVMKTQLVDEMDDFGKRLIAAGEKFDDELLIQIGKKFGDYADLFDVDKLTQTMYEFQFIVNRKLNGSYGNTTN